MAARLAFKVITVAARAMKSTKGLSLATLDSSVVRYAISSLNKLNNNQKVIIIERAKDKEIKVYNQLKTLNLTFLSM